MGGGPAMQIGCCSKQITLGAGSNAVPRCHIKCPWPWLGDSECLQWCQTFFVFMQRFTCAHAAPQQQRRITQPKNISTATCFSLSSCFQVSLSIVSFSPAEAEAISESCNKSVQGYNFGSNPNLSPHLDLFHISIW